MDVKTAGRTLEVFEAFSRLGRPLGMSDLAHHLQIPVSSCFAIVRTLQARGYVYTLRDRGPVYPTGRLLQVATAIAAHDPLRHRFLKLSAALRDEFDESVVIGVLRGGDVMYLHSEESTRSIRYAPTVGSLRSAHANSIGKALLAGLDEASLASHLAMLRFEALTPRTLTDPRALLDDLDVGRRRGWFQNLGESTTDLGAVACRVSVGEQSYGVSVAGPLGRIEAAGPERIGRRLARLCAEISDDTP